MNLHLSAIRSSRAWLRWLPTFAGFPLGGAIAHLVAGPADTLAATLAGGALAGLVLGLAQGLALRPRVALLPWTGVTAAG